MKTVYPPQTKFAGGIINDHIKHCPVGSTYTRIEQYHVIPTFFFRPISNSDFRSLGQLLLSLEITFLQENWTLLLVGTSDLHSFSEISTASV